MHNYAVAVSSPASEAGFVNVLIFVLTVIVAHVLLRVNLYMHIFLLPTVSCWMIKLVLLLVIERGSFPVMSPSCILNSLRIALAKATEHLSARVLLTEKRPCFFFSCSHAPIHVIRLSRIVTLCCVLDVKISLDLLQKLLEFIG